jgi:hypothetical protein
LSSQVAVERLAEVEKRSAWLRKELGLIDLVLMQILYVVGSSWVGTAAKLGTSHTVFWLLAIASFYLPQAAVVIFLSRMMPLEGAAGIFYALTYLALFAIPIFGVASLARRPSRFLRAAAVCGFAVTLLYSTLSVFPIIDVASWQIFAAKIIVVIVGANLLGVFIYAVGRRAGTVSSS